MTPNGVSCWPAREVGRQRKINLTFGTVRSVSIGEEHACALSKEGAIECWGEASRDRLKAPVMQRGDPWIQIAAGEAHTCAVARSGIAMCWGDNTYGQLALGTSGNAYTPVPVSVAAY